MSTLPSCLAGLQQNLAKEQSKQSARRIIDEYFTLFGLEALDEELWALTIGLLSNDLGYACPLAG